MSTSSFISRLKAALAPKSKLELKDLLAKGYFPEELPPPFNSKLFSDKITAKGLNLPKQFTEPKGKWCEYTTYSLARPGALRRRLAILNPLAYYRLSKEIVTHQKTLFKKASPSVVCLSHPRISTEGKRAITTHNSLSDLPNARAKSRVGKLFALQTDIARFYPSIYTHSLDWAITGKAKAKSNFGHGVNRLGTRIDDHVRAAQNGQTRGIPIGPDTSLLLAHVLLAPVDKTLIKKGITHGFRFLDDYELVFESRSLAEEALATLEEALAEYELELNSLKTSIQELPIELDNTAIVELREHPFQESGASDSSLVSFFNRAFILAKQNPSKAILRFAVGRIRNFRKTPKNPKLVKDLILQSATIEPGVWKSAIPILLRLHAESNMPEDPIRSVIEVTIRQQAPRQHSSEVAWALWAAMVFGIPLSLKTSKAVIRMKDDVCALLLLHAHEEGLATFDAWCNKHISQLANADELYGEHWLFSYEAVAKNWVTPVAGNFLATDPVFGYLEGKGVNFYDRNALATARTAQMPAASEEDNFSYFTQGASDDLFSLFDDYYDQEDE
jgi:hypothetical protein